MVRIVGVIALYLVACGEDSRVLLEPGAGAGPAAEGNALLGAGPMSSGEGAARGAGTGAEPLAAEGSGGGVAADAADAGSLGAAAADGGAVDGVSAAESTLPAGVDVGSLPVVTVSFTFDDTYGEQVQAAAMLEAHGLRGTFYVNSPELHRGTVTTNPAGPVTVAEALELQARGHDIGGHTLGHLSLTRVPEAERVREILADRAQLVQLGIEARSFAYPYGHVEDDDLSLGRAVLEVARESGYTSARDTNGFDLESCGGLESVPAGDPFILRSIRSVSEPPPGAELLEPEDTAGTLLGWLDRAAACGGGWLPLVFHRLAADCSGAENPQSYCFDFGELERLAAAIEPGVRCPGGEASGCYRIDVRTVSAVIGSDELAPAPEVPGLRNASLERTLASGATECVRRTGESPSAVFSRSEVARSGAASERLEIEAPFEAAAELGVERDYGACSLFVRAGNAYELSLHYRAEPADEAPLLRLVTYRLTAEYDWEEWELGEAFDAEEAGEWVRLELTTSAVPSGTIALSFGLRLESAGAVNVDDVDAVPLGSAAAGQ